MFLGLPVSYVLTGHFGLKLAVEPGYATTLFLPSGLAVSSCFFSFWALPGVWFGSLALNLWQGHEIDPLVNYVAPAIATGSTLQALFGGFVMRWCIHRPPETWDMLATTVLSPVICLVSSTLSLTAMHYIGTHFDVVRNWLSWWIGDTCGVIFVMGLVVLWMTKMSAPTRGRRVR